MTQTPRLPGSLAEIEASEAGPHIGTFLDMDGTLFHGQSGRYITRERRRRGEFGGSEVMHALAVYARGADSRHERFAELLDVGGAAWRGLTHAELAEMGDQVFERDVAPLIFPQMRAIVEAHRRRGHTVVLSSAASDFQVDPIARHLDIDHILCNHYVVEHGVLTGLAQRPVIYGPNKALAVQEFADANSIDLTRSYFYADGDEDVALMYLVGNPRPTNPAKHLAKVAEKRGWPILRHQHPTRVDTNAIDLVRALPGQGLGLARRALTSTRASRDGSST